VTEDVGQFHFDPDTYLLLIRNEVPAYHDLQAAVADACVGGRVGRILDLGAGTGETAAAVLQRHPQVLLTLLDESADMLERARRRLPVERIESMVIADLADPIDQGQFDLVVSALAVHHLDGAGKRALFEQVRASLRSGGRFVMGDVVVPDDPADAVTPLTPGFDRPDRVEDLLAWLRRADLVPTVTWQRQDLVVIACDVG
jgi:tRNA (cmo5U34)-methyltransferase